MLMPGNYSEGRKIALLGFSCMARRWFVDSIILANIPGTNELFVIEDVQKMKGEDQR
jgi:hypothetical protein